jgi:hypothetical protein
MVYETLNSIQNALQYSKVTTEFILLLNEQTLLDDNPIIPPNETWDEFLCHPMISRCKILRVTNKDELFGISKFYRDYYNKDGLTYWGECDCYLPIEFFYINESFQNEYKNRPYVLTFANRKMWSGWEIIEHPLAASGSLSETDKNYLDKNDPEKNFLRLDGPMSIRQLYKFNNQQGNPEIVMLPTSRIEGTLCTLSDGMPKNLLCPNNIFSHGDYNLELSMKYYNIPQFHVKNLIKGHDQCNPNKRSNIIGKSITSDRSTNVKNQMDKDKKAMHDWIQKLYNGELK